MLVLLVLLWLLQQVKVKQQQLLEMEQVMEQLLLQLKREMVMEQMLLKV